VNSPTLDYTTPNKRAGRRNGVLICVGTLTSLFPSACLVQSLNILFFVPLFVGIACAIAGIFRMYPYVKSRARVTAIGLILCVAASLGPFLYAAWLNREGRPIKIVLPVGYRGEFSIVKDHIKGQDLKREDGAWVFEIPPNGVLIVKDTSPFFLRHREDIVYPDGAPARVQDLGVEAGNIITGPGSSKGSSEYDGTTLRWKSLDK
jgi:hypothetical protein